MKTKKTRNKKQSSKDKKQSFHDWLNEKNVDLPKGQKIVVLAPDGLDRSSAENFTKDFRENLITEQEFNLKLSYCTLLSNYLPEKIIGL